MAKILGVGPGVFVVAFFMILCSLIAYLGSKTRNSSPILLGSGALFCTVVAILALSPREDGSVTSNSELGEDLTVIERGFMMIGMSMGVLLAIVGLLIFHVEPPKYAKPLDYRTDVLRS